MSDIAVSVSRWSVGDASAVRQFNRFRVYQVLAHQSGTITMPKVVAMAQDNPDLIPVLREALFWRRAICRHYNLIANRGLKISLVPVVWFANRFNKCGWQTVIQVSNKEE